MEVSKSCQQPLPGKEARIEGLLQLMDKTGCDLVQINGQRKLGPPKDWSGPPPLKGCEIFIGRLPRDVFEDELFPLFETIGKIYEIRLMMDFSGFNRGFAFVQFGNPHDAFMAVKMLNNYEIRPSKRIGVQKSIDNCRLFVGGIPTWKTRQEIAVEVEKLIEGIIEIIIYSDPVHKMKNRGFAFIEFVDHRAAAVARRKLLMRKHNLWGYDITVDWADPEPEVHPSIMAKVTILHVRNVLGIAVETLKSAFRNVTSKDAVEKVKKIKDFAFVHFTTRQYAEKALIMMNGKEINGSQIQVVWAKPKDHVQPVAHHAYELPEAIKCRLDNGYNTCTSFNSSGYQKNGPHYYAFRKQMLKSGAEARKWLHEIGQIYNWGEPVHQVMALDSSSSYICRIYFPLYNGDQSVFQSRRKAPSPEEAKAVAAVDTMRNICQILKLTAGYGQGSFIYGNPLIHHPASVYFDQSNYFGNPEVPFAYAQPDTSMNCFIPTEVQHN